MPSAVIGALRVDLTLGNAGWRRGLNSAADDANAAKGKLQKIGGDITKVGAGLTAGLTAPLAGLGVAAVKTAANFETAMNKLGIATQASTAEMSRMNDMALELGKTTVFSASEAAGAMEELAKNGVSVADILGGAAKAAVDLAAATGSDLEPAAVAVSDAMNQFHIAAKDLPRVVNQITGAVNESKLDFADFQLAMAQAGGVAGGLGVSFEDFNAVLAGTSSLFASGSDAGTSFKTFLTTFVPKSKQAAAAMQEYGLKFFDANGKMKSMSDVAEMLRTKLAGLSDEAKNDVLSTIFGTDAMRTAVGLMNLGADGLDKIADKIAKTDAALQSAQRMKGLNAELEQLGGSFETLAIKVGQTGLLSTVAAVVAKVADFVDILSDLSPGVAQAAVAGAALAAAIGPIMLVVGPVLTGLGALAGVVTGWAGALSTAAVAAGGLIPLLAPLAPIVLAVAGAAAAAYVAWENWGTIGPILTEWASGVVDRVTEAGKWLNKIPEWITAINGGEQVSGPFVSKTAVEETKASFGELEGRTREFTTLLRSEFVKTWDSINAKLAEFEQIGPRVDAAVMSLWKSFEELHARAQSSFNEMTAGIKNAVNGVLGPVLSWVEDKARKVGDAFYTLYDRVVGHSYIPDMVDGIAHEMGRLDTVMVAKTKAATDASATHMKGLSDKAKEAAKEHQKAARATADAWKKMAGDIGPLIDKLFPEVRALMQSREDMATIAKAQKMGYLTPAAAVEAQRRVRIGVEGVEAADNRPDPFAEALEPAKLAVNEWKSKLPDFSKMAKKTTAEVVESFAGMARDVLGSLRGMVASFKGGDILGGIVGLMDIVVQGASAIRGISAPRQAVTITGGNSLPYGGGRALGGPVVPGKRYRVGERGKGEWFEPGVSGRIVPDDDGGRRGTTHNYFEGNLLTPEFWEKIQAGHDMAAVRGAAGGAQLAAEQQSAARARFIG